MDGQQGLMSGPAVAALVRRGLSPSALMQQAPMMTQATPGSPNFDPNMQTPPPSPTPNMSPMSASDPTPATPMAPPDTNPGQPGVQPGGGVQPVSEAQIIVNALIKRLEAHSKHATKSSDLQHKFLEQQLIQPEVDNGQQQA